MFKGEAAVHLEVLADAFDHLEVDVVERGSAGDQDGIAAQGRGLGGRARDKVLGRLLVARPDLEPFIAAQVIGDPCLATLVFASDPVAEELALVGIALFLDRFPIHEEAIFSGCDR